MAEPGFMDRVLQDMTYWKAGVRDVIEAVKRNAEDTSRADQGWWNAYYLVLVEHPMAEAAVALLERR